MRDELKGLLVTGFEKYANSRNVKEYPSIRPERSFQSASLAVMCRWWIAPAV